MFPFYTPENTRKPRFFGVFREYKMRTLARNVLNKLQQLSFNNHISFKFYVGGSDIIRRYNNKMQGF